MTSFSLKGILLQYGGFLVAMLAVAITVVSPRSEALFGISTTTCLLIGASSSLFLFSLSFFFFRMSSVSARIGIRFFVSPNDARFDTMYIVQKPTGGKLTNQQQRHKKKQQQQQASRSRSSLYHSTKCARTKIRGRWRRRKRRRNNTWKIWPNKRSSSKKGRRRSRKKDVEYSTWCYYYYYYYYASRL